jgi:hypothetical protein
MTQPSLHERVSAPCSNQHEPYQGLKGRNG